MKLIILTLSIFFFTAASVSCKKKQKTISNTFLNGSWNANFNSCQTSLDSSVSIFTHTNNLVISGIDDWNYKGSVLWGGCVDGQGEFLIKPSDREGYHCTLVFKGPGEFVFDENYNMVPPPFDWSGLVPPGSDPDEGVLNLSKIYVKRIQENNISLLIVYPGGNEVSYSWNK